MATFDESIAAWRAYVRICCRGLEPGAYHSYSAQASTLWDAGAMLRPDDPEAGFALYLEDRIAQARAKGRQVPHLKFLVEDLAAWVDAKLAGAPKPREHHTMSPPAAVEREDVVAEPCPAELLAKVGRKVPEDFDAKQTRIRGATPVTAGIRRLATREESLAAREKLRTMIAGKREKGV